MYVNHCNVYVAASTELEYIGLGNNKVLCSGKNL